MKNVIKKSQVKSSWFMKLVSVAIALTFIAPVMINAQAGKTNFSGSWTLNESKSTLPQGGGGQRMGGGSLAVTQDANLLTVNRTRTGQDGQPQTTTMKYTLDGKESVNTTPRGESKSTATWSSDGKSLTIKTTSDFNGNTFTTTAVWSLTDPKILTIETTMPDRNGGADRKMTMVYDKK